MIELVISVLDSINERYIISMILNIVSMTGSTILLFMFLHGTSILLKVIRITVLVIWLVLLVLMLQSIFDFSDAIQTLKTVYETIIYKTGTKSV